MLKRIETNGVRTIIVETASRFARDLIVQETGYAMLKERGIDLVGSCVLEGIVGEPTVHPRRCRRST